MFEHGDYSFSSTQDITNTNPDTFLKQNLGLNNNNNNPPTTRYLNKLGKNGPFRGEPRSICDSICDWARHTWMCADQTIVNPVPVHSPPPTSFGACIEEGATSQLSRDGEARPTPGRHVAPRLDRHEETINEQGDQPSTGKCPRVKHVHVQPTSLLQATPTDQPPVEEVNPSCH
jgi:hypothetical protein